MAFETNKLTNGIPVVVSPAPGTPRTCVCVAIRGGSRTEPVPGVAGMASRLLLKGTESRTAEEIAEEIEKPVVKRLLRLMEFRCTYHAFDGQFTIEDAADDQLKLSWVEQPLQTVLHVHLRTYRADITYFDTEQKKTVAFTA